MGTRQGLPVPTSSPGNPPGFSAQLHGASLFDLIQFEAGARGRRVVRVTSDEHSALLYFEDGRIVHASAGRFTGEPAVRELLTWDRGTFARFEHFGGPWPRIETIKGSTEGVLLRAAQALDEGVGNLVALPRREQASGEIVTPRGRDEEVVVHLSPSGEVLEQDGPEDGFGDLVAYAAQLTDRVGDLLGLPPFDLVELTFHGSKCVLSRKDDGCLLAAKGGPGATLEGLRQRIGG